jgi:tRNA (cmo5U34)-methyltransferase
MSPAWSAGFSEPFDAVVSSRAIHNVRFPDRIRAIYGEVFATVAPGGCFLNFDEVVSAGPLVANAEAHGQLMARRRRLYEQSGQWQNLSSPELQGRRRLSDPGQASEEDQGRMAAHVPATVANQLSWLVAAGFAEADCPWRDGNRAILAAFRAS